jgi:hypothetical protein
MRNGKPGEAALAANSLLDRGWGKPSPREIEDCGVKTWSRWRATARVEWSGTGPSPEFPSRVPAGREGKREAECGGALLPLVRASLPAPPGWLATGVLQAGLA